MVPIRNSQEPIHRCKHPTSGGEIRMAVPVEQKRDCQESQAHRARQPFPFVDDERDELVDHSPVLPTASFFQEPPEGLR